MLAIAAPLWFVKVYAINIVDQEAVEQLRDRTHKLLAHICYSFITITGSVPEEIVRVA